MADSTENSCVHRWELNVLAAKYMHQVLGAVQTFLDDMEHQLRTDPDFKGQLGSN